METIRFYQRKDLLPEPDKPYGSIRRYGEADVARVRFVKSAQRLGFSLDEIAGLLRLDDGTHCEEASSLAEHKLQDVREKMADLARMEAVLSELVCACYARKGNVSCPLIASLLDGMNLAVSVRGGGSWIDYALACFIFRILRRPLEGQHATVRVAYDEEQIRRDLASFLLLGIGIPLAVMAASLAGYWLAGRALAPVAKMTEEARSITAEHLDVRLPIRTADDELGLGLAIARWSAETHGGRIDFETEMNRGSVFRIRLPVV